MPPKNGSRRPLDFMRPQDAIDESGGIPDMNWLLVFLTRSIPQDKEMALIEQLDRLLRLLEDNLIDQDTYVRWMGRVKNYEFIDIPAAFCQPRKNNASVDGRASAKTPNAVEWAEDPAGGKSVHDWDPQNEKLKDYLLSDLPPDNELAMIQMLEKLLKIRNKDQISQTAYDTLVRKVKNGDYFEKKEAKGELSWSPLNESLEEFLTRELSEDKDTALIEQLERLMKVYNGEQITKMEYQKWTQRIKSGDLLEDKGDPEVWSAKECSLEEFLCRALPEDTDMAMITQLERIMKVVQNNQISQAEYQRWVQMIKNGDLSDKKGDGKNNGLLTPDQLEKMLRDDLPDDDDMAMITQLERLLKLSEEGRITKDQYREYSTRIKEQGSSNH